MGKYITERERYMIEAYLKAGLKAEKIAALIGKHINTIYNEIKRGKCKQLTSNLEEKEVYLADVAQRKIVYHTFSTKLYFCYASFFPSLVLGATWSCDQVRPIRRIRKNLLR